MFSRIRAFEATFFSQLYFQDVIARWRGNTDFFDDLLYDFFPFLLLFPVSFGDAFFLLVGILQIPCQFYADVIWFSITVYNGIDNLLKFC